MEKKDKIIQQIGGEIQEERRSILKSLSDHLKKMLENKEKIELIFICTHNSRRSQFAQAWSAFLVDYYQLPIQVFSGGTEVTEIPEHVVSTLKNSGFQMDKIEEKVNPKYALSWNDQYKPVLMYSKLYDDHSNPNDDFIAVMTCSHADENCPFISGAEERFSLNYEDPKRFDGKVDAAAHYEKCSQTIAAEMNYVFSKLTRI